MHRALALICMSLLLVAQGRADIFRWDNGDLIPGTEGVTPGPGVVLSQYELAYAELSDYDLATAQLNGADLSFAAMYDSNLSSANFDEANLTGADLHEAILAGATLNNAMVQRADFSSMYTRLSKEQLYSTASYKEKDLSGIVLRQLNMSNWDFSGQNLANANLSNASVHGDLSGANLNNATLSNTRLNGAILRGADLSNANLTLASLDYTDLTDAIVKGGNFHRVADRFGSFTKEQFYSTSSYKTGELTAIRLTNCELDGWDFHDQDLTNAQFSSSMLRSANFRGAKLAGAVFRDAHLDWASFDDADIRHANMGNSFSFSREMLVSTASFKAKDLTGFKFPSIIDGLDLRGFNLTDADFATSYFVFSRLDNAVIEGANFSASDVTKAHLYSTASYKNRRLSGVWLGYKDLQGWNFSQQNLAGALFNRSNVSNADFSGADVEAAYFINTTSFGFVASQLYSTASYQAKDLSGVALGENDLSGWDFTGQRLTDSYFNSSILAGTDFSFADTRGARWLDLSSSIANNTIRPDGTILGVDLANDDRLVIRNLRDTSTESISIRVHAEANFSQNATLQMSFDNDPWQSLISFEPGITVQLDGMLALTIAADVDVYSQIGRTIRIFDWSGVEPQGAFRIVSDYSWDVSQLYTTGEVTLRFAGDTDGDGDVDLQDLNNVRNNFGGVGPGDTNNDGMVDLVDLNNVRNYFGLSQLQSVSEPSAIVLLLVAALAARARRWKR